MWTLSRRRRNQLQHALHGNGPPSADEEAWRTVGRPKLSARDLQELQPAGKLRSAGWVLPESVPADYLVRVYDTRLEPKYLKDLIPELGVISTGTAVVIGGDFISQPLREDAEALNPLALRRWGPPGDAAYTMLVQPRPHLAEWFGRARQQLAVEAPGSWISVCCVVPRERCSESLDKAAVRRMVPQAAGVLDDASLEVRVTAIGERPLVLRIPATEQQLPPQKPALARLPRDRVLVVVSFKQSTEGHPALAGRWIRGSLPDVPTEDLEMLRLECVLPPATRPQTAERTLRTAVRRLAEAMGLPVPAAAQLRQIQIAHGSVLALLGVPRDCARTWLCGSGCGGLYVRPFWTDSTGGAVARSQFTLLWMRGHAEDGPRIWEAVRHSPDVYGLLASSKDVAVRVSAGVDVAALQAQLQFVLGEKSRPLRRAVPGQRWWRLGPLRDAEVWAAKELIAGTGLAPLRDEFRIARAGPFRTYVYFAASGTPTKTSLDDGSWGSSEACLTPADPPPRKQQTAVANKSSHVPGPALASQSSWAGPRKAAVAASDRTATPPTTASGAPGKSVKFAGSPVVDSTPPFGVGSQTRQPRRRGGRNETLPTVQDGIATGRVPITAQPSSMEVQLTHLTVQVGQLLQEIRELRKENSELRRQVEAARGLQQHQPYASTSSLVPIPAPSFSPVRPSPGLPGRTRISTEMSPVQPLMGQEAVGGGDVGMDSPPPDADTKRARRSLASDLQAGSAAGSLFDSEAPSGHAEC